jgi:hypothetical protein
MPAGINKSSLANLRPKSANLIEIELARSPVTEARQLQRLVFQDCSDSKTNARDRAALARAWCVLQDCIRVMRGLPLPGQYRPEADPAKLMKQLKSAMKKSPIDASAIKTFNAPTEDEPTPTADQPPTEKPAKVEPTKKESLLTDGTVTAGGG